MIDNCHKLFVAPVILLMALTVIISCAPATNPEDTFKTPGPLSTAKALSPWDELVKEGQKEGAVNIYASDVAPVVQPLRDAFKKRFDINLDFTQGRSADVIAKVTAEKRAGLDIADVALVGETAAAMDLKPLEITIPLTDLLVAPEVKNPGNWVGGNLPFLDKEHNIAMFMAMAQPHGIANSDMVKEGDLSSFLDLLKPQWKGKIVLSDPGVAGASANLLAAMYKTFGREQALEVFRNLAKQEPAITRDQRLLTEWVARGKYPIALGHTVAIFSEFQRMGAPVKFLNLKEPRFISAGPGNLMVFKKNPNPKATQVFVNWLLDKEGSTIWSTVIGHPSRRLDVTRDHVDPASVPRADDIFPDEEHLKLRVEMRKFANDIFAQVTK